MEGVSRLGSGKSKIFFWKYMGEQVAVSEKIKNSN
jgi:hypothetical protein